MLLLYVKWNEQYVVEELSQFVMVVQQLLYERAR